MTTDLVHCASALCAASADRAFTYVATPARLGEWALGCWQAVEGEGGIVSGTSLFDGATTFARPVADPRLRIVDFEVGGDPSELVRRISARIVPGPDIGRSPDSSLVVVTALRTASMDDERWLRLVVAHETEVLLLRRRIEAVD
jgi:hypothetical protein